MSRVYFHSLDGQSELRGSERAYAGWLTNNLGIAALDLQNNEAVLLRALRPAIREGRFLDLMLRVDGHRHQFVCPDGTEENAWTVILNTCVDMGSEALCLLARVHGQCEIHCFVEGEDRAWLAGVIQRGRDVGILRAKQGWEEVAAHLLRSAEYPVVMSYSVCDQFPNRKVVETNDEWDAWAARTTEEQWSLCMEKIREPGRHLRIGPNTLTTVGFGSGLNAFELIEKIQS